MRTASVRSAASLGVFAAAAVLAVAEPAAANVPLRDQGITPTGITVNTTSSRSAESIARGLRPRLWCWLPLALLAFAPAATGSPCERVGVAATLSQIHLSVRPNLAETNAITSFRFLATRRVGDVRRPVRDATIRFAGARARTGRRGRAVIIRRLETGVYRPHACKPALECGVARVVALPHG